MRPADGVRARPPPTLRGSTAGIASKAKATRWQEAQRSKSGHVFFGSFLGPCAERRSQLALARYKVCIGWHKRG